MDIGALKTEESSGPAASDLNVINDQEDAMRLAKSRDTLEPSIASNVDAAFGLTKEQILTYQEPPEEPTQPWLSLKKPDPPAAA